MMTTTRQWRCVYCETWNLVTSPSCLVCERARPEDAVATERTFERSQRPPPPPPPPPLAPSGAAPGRASGGPIPPAALSRGTSLPPSVRIAPEKPTPSWVVPLLILVIGLLTVGAVVLALRLTAG